MDTPSTKPGRQLLYWLGAAAVTVLIAAIAIYFWQRQRDEQHASNLQAASEANARGVGLMEQFEYSGAAEEFEKAIKLAPDWLPARINHGMSLYNSASRVDDPVLPQAIAIFEQVLRDDPNNPYGHFNLGIIYQYQGKLEPAQIHFRKVTEIDPEDDRAWLYLAHSYPNSATEEEPKRHYKKALELNPRNVKPGGLCRGSRVNPGGAAAFVAGVNRHRKQAASP